MSVLRTTDKCCESVADLWFAFRDDHATQLIHYKKIKVARSAAEELLEEREDRTHGLRGILQRHGDVAQHDHDVLRYNFVLQLLVAFTEAEYITIHFYVCLLKCL